MLSHRPLALRLLLGFCLAALVALPAFALEKEGMPDIGQE